MNGRKVQDPGVFRPRLSRAAALRIAPHLNAFSLVELVFVIVIIGLLASMAIPRLSRGAEDAGQATLDVDLAIVRLAIQHYAAEHRGVFPGATEVATVQKLTLYSNCQRQCAGSEKCDAPVWTLPGRNSERAGSGCIDRGRLDLQPPHQRILRKHRHHPARP